MDLNKMEVVISRYKEDISWADQIKYKTLIFNKNSEENHLFENNLPNVGRETHTYITYIINNYHNLPKYVAFMQGHPFDHAPNAIELVNSFNLEDQFLPIGKIIESDVCCDIPQQIKRYSIKYDFEIGETAKYVVGAQFIISAEIIKNRSLDFYKKLNEGLKYDICPWDSYDFEKCALEIFKIKV